MRSNDITRWQHDEKLIQIIYVNSLISYRKTLEVLNLWKTEQNLE